MLRIKNVTVNFGGIVALNNVNIDIEKGAIIGLIGPNGAGKTTVFNVISGIYNPNTGRIEFSNYDITYKKTYQVSALGISRTFQNIRLFKELSVIDNVKISFHKNISYNLFDAIFRTSKFLKEEEQNHKKAEELLKIFGLYEKRFELAKNLPYGEQRKLEIVRALATSPKLLLLDEPAAGMNPQETQELKNLIKFIKEKFDLTILLIEHDMSVVMDICEKIYVLDYGEVIAVGTPVEVKNNPRVIEAYLGEGDLEFA
ncbi:ABC transporter related protein [Caldicellulosiruptor acetigenus I77R1B]|nr:ABC transporter ATP-binding protein [Caldicellulosiruptor acetigenus]ADQ40881.1 ABC transporter related protein [Caldicellulosiruptor acetigenus I77R1B]WAM37495.1 ABC transporter ATP-binding protein [Caldicellulosiruptor acetigenus]